MVFVGMIMSMLLSPVHAGEEIQLAAVMTESDSDNLTANKRLYAIGDGRSGGALRAGSRDPDFEYAVIGVVAVGILAFIATDGSTSTSNH